MSQMECSSPPKRCPRVGDVLLIQTAYTKASEHTHTKLILRGWQTLFVVGTPLSLNSNHPIVTPGVCIDLRNGFSCPFSEPFARGARYQASWAGDLQPAGVGRNHRHPPVDSRMFLRDPCVVGFQGKSKGKPKPFRGPKQRHTHTVDGYMILAHRRLV